MCCLGLRTLCLGVADISENFYSEWNEIYQKASTAVRNRQELIDHAAELIEKVNCPLCVDMPLNRYQSINQ